MGGSRGEWASGLSPPPSWKIAWLGFCPDRMKNQKATKPVINVRPSLACQRNVALQWDTGSDIRNQIYFSQFPQ